MGDANSMRKLQLEEISFSDALHIKLLRKQVLQKYTR